MSVIERAARRAKTPPWRMPFTNKELLEWLGKGLVIPPEGWNALTFAAHGAQLISTIHRTANVTLKKAVPHMARTITTMLNNQIEQVCVEAEGRKADMESLWMESIERVFAKHGLDINTMAPPIQSITTQGYSKVNFLLGQENVPETTARLNRDATEIAAKISRIDETTRKIIEREIRRSIAEGLTVADTARALRAAAPQLNHWRSLMIARTELNRAWTHGAAASYQESSTITHVSVIGCEAEEPGSPHYHGRSTCNYPALPITDLDAFLEVGFHVNHSGTLCASGFR
jgi:hypothetical protein